MLSVNLPALRYEKKNKKTKQMSISRITNSVIVTRLLTSLNESIALDILIQSTSVASLRNGGFNGKPSLLYETPQQLLTCKRENNTNNACHLNVVITTDTKISIDCV